MSSYWDVWNFTRERLDAAWQDLSDEQLDWRPFQGAHSTLELLVHIAGAEHYWWTRFTGVEPRSDPFAEKLDRAVREGFLRDGEVPFGPDELTKEVAAMALAHGREKLGPILRSPTPEQLEMEIESPIGPMVTGHGGLLRIAQHAAYHTGQMWLMRMDPRFPA